MRFCQLDLGALGVQVCAGLILAHWVSRFAPVCVPPGLRADRFADCWLSRFTSRFTPRAFDGCPGLRSPVPRRWADARSGGTRGVVVLRIDWSDGVKRRLQKC